MDKAVESEMPHGGNTFVKGCHRVGCHQSLKECLADNLVYERVCQKIQIDHALLRLHICNVRNPNLVVCLRLHSS